MAYGKYRHSTFYGEKGSTWNVEIWKKDFGVPEVGDEIGGGVVLHVSATDVYIIAKDDLSPDYEWGCSGTNISGADGTAIGTGKQNTADIVAGCGDTDSAAYICSNLTLNGYSDWYLPSKDEAYKFYVNKTTLEAVSGFQSFSGGYWTSSEASSIQARYIFPSSGSQGSLSKSTTTSVRPIRSYAIGTSTEMDLAGEGFEVTWNGSGGTRDRVFLGSECKLNCIVKDGTDESFLYDTFSSGYQEYFIRIYRGAVSDSNLWWYGWVQPAFDKVENAPFPYVAQLTSTDSYGFWSKKKEEYFSDEDEKNAPHSIRDILFTLINDMDIRDVSAGDLAPVPNSFYWCRTSMDWWSSPHTYNSADPSVLYLAAKGFVSKPTTSDEGGNIELDQDAYKYKPSDVFDGVLKSFNTVGFLAEGYYNFIQPNNLADNTSGDLRVYEYNSGLVDNPANPYTLNTLLTIDQSSNVILQGSTINYEPSFEGVKVNHKGGSSNFDIGSGQDLTTSFLAGSLQSGLSGQLQLNFFAKHYERITTSDFSLDTGYNVVQTSFKTTGTLTIRITDGTNERYLVQTSQSNTLQWQTSSGSITIKRGYAVEQTDPVNNESQMCVGLVSNPIPNNPIGNSYGPMDVATFSTYQKFYSEFIFEAFIEYPDISGDIYIQFTADNDYYQGDSTTVGTYPNIDYEWDFLDVNDPTPVQESTTCENITLVPVEFNSDNDVTDGIIYTASQTNNTAIEQFDLGDVNLGQSSVNNLYSFQYNSGTGGSPIYETIPGFRRGNAGSYINASQLLVNEFLHFQIDPLEILQAEIQSANISPLKLVKYSINDDGSYKYYSFLGGTFKAQSEILSGEWYEVNSITTNITGETTPDGPTQQPPIGTTEQIVNQQNLVGRQMLDNNSYGVIASTLTNGTTDTKVTLGATSKGKIYSGQKLVLTYPDGSNPLILTASGDSTTSDTQIDLSSFTLKISYPKGSILSPLLYDLTNVITSTPNLYKGVTTTAIYIAPNEFNVTTTSAVVMYTRDNIGSVQPSSYVNRSKAYATSFIPLGYRVTAVDVDSSQNRNITVLSGRWGNDTTTSQGTGTANTTLTLSSAWSSVEGDYIIISYEFGADTDEIYGAKITIAAI